MHLTVAIPTWNRSRLLAQTLTQMTLLRVPDKTTWELLVVDNNSTDDTRTVTDLFEGRLPIRRIFEPAPGVSHARNRAVKEASGAYILWADDDVMVEPTWMMAYVTAFVRRPTAGFFGGVIRPWFPLDPPEWLRRGFDYVAEAYGARDFGQEEIPLTIERRPYGANMAFRIGEQREFLFDCSLGPRAGSSLRGEETDVFLRMLAHGIEGTWVPDAIVRHYVPPEHQSVGYLRKYYMGYGEYLALTKDSPDVRGRIFGKPRWLWRSAFRNEVGYRIGRAMRHKAWLMRLRDASIAWGWLLRE